jgi:hypothetical protein
MLDNTVLQHKFSCFFIKTIFFRQNSTFFYKNSKSVELFHVFIMNKKCYFCA